MRWPRRRASLHSNLRSSSSSWFPLCSQSLLRSGSIPSRASLPTERQARDRNLMKDKIRGLHHVTAIASEPQRNLDFYVGLLGLRFVKRTVNFDDPGSYHFYFGDNRGTPGTILTFFPWPGARRGIRGTGQIEVTAFAISPDSISYWMERFKQHHATAERTSTRSGEKVIRFSDPDGLLIELIASSS